MTTPAMLALDLELAAPIPDGAPDFMGAAIKAGPSVVCALQVGIDQGITLYADRNRDTLPDDWDDGPSARYAADQRESWRAHITKSDGLVTWNGIRFDAPVLTAWWAMWDWTLGEGYTHVDLCALCSLLDAGVPADHLRDIPAGWYAKARAEGYRIRRGWRLDRVANATLGQGKAPDMSGKDAPILWQRGELEKVTRYCGVDAQRTRKLYEVAWAGKPLSNGERSVVIPRELLG